MNNKEFDLKLREKVFEVFQWGKIITTYDYKCEVIEVSFIFYCMDETRSRYWSFIKQLIRKDISKTRIKEIYLDLQQGYELNGRGYRK